MKEEADTSTNGLHWLRSQIDTVDNEIVTLINKRAALALQMKGIKGTSPVYAPARESQVIRRITALNNGPLSDTAVQNIYQEIISSCRNIQSLLRVGYLGPKGTYSEEAAVKLFGSTAELIPCTDLAGSIRQVELGNTDIALLPIENSSEGAVIDAHKLLLDTNLAIVREIYMPIRHNVLSKASALTKIKHVYGHPQALGQVREWIRNHLPHAIPIPSISNGEAAKRAQEDILGVAIASKRAAVEYGLHILAENINDQATNTTRFIALASIDTQPSGKDKTSVICVLKDKPGALYELLKVLAERSISMNRLESQRYKDGEYAFYIDIAGHKSEQNLVEVLQEMQKICKTFKILGSYPEAVEER